MFGKNILVLVPHPDDEIVACAATIGRAQAEGAKIFALYLTHGCLARETLWPWQRSRYTRYVERRRAEGDMAALFLNITPVGWSPRPARYLWQQLPDVWTEIQRAVDQSAIDQVWVPAYEGGNADHDALNALSSLLAKKISVLEFAEYNFKDGHTHSQTFPDLKGGEQIIKLTPEEHKKKRKALSIYKSEKNNLGYVATSQECFRTLITYDYSLPPHTGTLWYARFQWVPFRHPRVDFTKPADVSAAIMNFLGKIQA